MPKLARSLVGFLIAGAISTFAAEAAAEEESEPKGRWYGYQTLEVLAVSDLALGAGIGLAATSRDRGPGEALIIAGVAGHVVGPPVVHFAHQHHAGPSLFLQAGLPLIVAVPAFGIGLAVPESCHGDCNSALNLTGAFLAVAGAAGGTLLVGNIIDVALLSTKPKHGEPERALFVAPLAGRGRTGLVVGGEF